MWFIRFIYARGDLSQSLTNLRKNFSRFSTKIRHQLARMISQYTSDLDISLKHKFYAGVCFLKTCTARETQLLWAICSIGFTRFTAQSQIKTLIFILRFFFIPQFSSNTCQYSQRKQTFLLSQVHQLQPCAFVN